MGPQDSRTAKAPPPGRSRRGINPLYLYGIPAVILALALAALISFQLTSLPFLWSWLLSINAVTFFCFGYDKNRARSHGLRLPENLLYFLTLTGGGPGALLGMRVWRHKRAKTSFLLVFWLIIAFQAALAVLAYVSLRDPGAAS